MYILYWLLELVFDIHTWIFVIKSMVVGWFAASFLGMILMDKNNMTPTPWTLDNTHRQDGNISLIGSDKRQIGNLFQNKIDSTPANAAAIVSAINATYGNGINPEAVKDLLKSLEGMMETFKYIGGVGYNRKKVAMEAAKAAIEKAKL